MPRLLLHPAGLRALLGRREAAAAARERAAVEAALAEAGPELRAELLRRLGPGYPPSEGAGGTAGRAAAGRRQVRQ